MNHPPFDDGVLGTEDHLSRTEYDGTVTIVNIEAEEDDKRQNHEKHAEFAKTFKVSFEVIPGRRRGRVFHL